MGMSSLIMNVMTLIQAVLVLNALNAYGTNSDVAFYGVAYRIFTFMLTPVFGLMRALQPAVGINYGAGKYRRVIQSFYVFAVVSNIVIVTVLVNYDDSTSQCPSSNVAGSTF